MKPLNSRHLRVLKNLSVIKTCPLLGGSLTKIATFGTKNFVRYWEVSLYFCSTKWTLWLWNVVSHSFQNQNNRKARHIFAPRPLIFKSQRKFLKFNNSCVSWSSPETDSETSFSNLETRSYENVGFSQW